MAKCDLTLRVEDETKVYRPGDNVRGMLEVRVDSDVKCNGLKIGLRWRTHGRGNSVSEEIASEILFDGEWTAGTTWSGPFELQFPAGPYTYHGHYLNVVWEVFARADIPWAIDPKTEVEIVLEPDPESEPDFASAIGTPDRASQDVRKLVNDEPDEPPAKSSGCAGNTLGIGCLLILLGPFLFFLVAGIWRTVQFARGEISLGEGLPWMVIGLVMLVIIFFGAFRGLRNLIARKKLGKVQLRIEPELVRAGQDIGISVSFKPEKATDLISARATVKATEIVVRGSGTNKSTYRQVVFEEDVELAPARALPPGIPFQAATKASIPPDAPPSFYASSNKLSWEVEVRLDIARWPDWVRTTEIVVHP